MSTEALKDPREEIHDLAELAAQLILSALETPVTLGSEESDALLRDALHYIRDAQVHNQLLRGMP